MKPKPLTKEEQKMTIGQLLTKWTKQLKIEFPQ